MAKKKKKMKSGLGIHRGQLLDKLLEECSCEGIIWKKSQKRTLLRFLEVDGIQVDHMWVKEESLLKIPIYTKIKFTAIVTTYDKPHGIFSFQLINLGDIKPQ